MGVNHGELSTRLGFVERSIGLALTAGVSAMVWLGWTTYGEVRELRRDVAHLTSDHADLGARVTTLERGRRP